MKAKPQEVVVGVDDFVQYFMADHDDLDGWFVDWIENQLNISVVIDHDENLHPLSEEKKQFLLKLQGPHGKTIMAAYKAKYGEALWQDKE